MWVHVRSKMAKKSHTSHLTPNPVFPEKEVLKSHILLAHLSKLRYKLSGVHSIKHHQRQSLFFTETNRKQQMKETCHLKVLP